MTTWYLNEIDPEALGYLPDILSDKDPRPAKEQIEDRYASGWRPLTGMTFDEETVTLNYPGDPPYEAIAFANIGEEMVMVFMPGSWVMVMQQDGSYEVARMD